MVYLTKRRCFCDLGVVCECFFRYKRAIRDVSLHVICTEPPVEYRRLHCRFDGIAKGVDPRQEHVLVIPLECDYLFVAIFLLQIINAF